ncbi:MAG: leucyl aminopeptidase family protein [Pseudonocardia sp.]
MGRVGTGALYSASTGVIPTIPTSLLSVVAVERVTGAADEPKADVVTIDAQRRADDVDPGLIDRFGATGKADEVHALPDGRWLLGIGDGEPTACRTAGAALARALAARAARVMPDLNETADEAAELAGDNPEPVGHAVVDLAIDVTGWSEPARSALVTGLLLGSHRFRVSRRKQPAQPRLRLLAPGAELASLNEAVTTAVALAEATALARDLASMPSDVKTPTWLVETAAGLAAEVPGLKATVWPRARLAEEGFGGMLAVGDGSSRPPALLRLDWAPAANRTDTRHLVLVGKGVTFDTGGISIKPADGMHLMRTDMSGGAAVIAAMLAVGRLELPMRVTGLVPAAENHVSGSAYRPGDVVRHYDGTTTEVGNTDAEGRMVLADAIGYAVRELAPDLIVDVATLTGSMKIALGLRIGGLFATDDSLAEMIIQAGDRVGERWWRMPLLEHVADEVPSDIADIRQTPKGPGGISAALFLRHFTKDLPWVHLDIAGPARCDKPYAEVSPGATGFAARTLVELVRGYAGH